MDKVSLRKWAKEERKKLDMTSVSQKLVQKLVTTKEYQQAKHIMIFHPLKDEVNLLDLLEDKSKQFYLPKVDGDNLLCCPYCFEDEVYPSCYGIYEPLKQNVNPDLIDLVIVPALCCDKNNYRLGYGGGFYDRFLSDKEVNAIVCIPKQLLVETIYPEEFDVPVDNIIIA